MSRSAAVPASFPFPDAMTDLRDRRLWWRHVLAAGGERRAVFDGWLAAALAARPELAGVSWRWFAGAAPRMAPADLAVDAVMQLGAWWESAGRDRQQGQWFTPPDLVGNLLATWANDWLEAAEPGLTWRAGELQGRVSAVRAAELLADWGRLQVLDPAMGAGDWLLGWVWLHRTVAAALAERADCPAPGWEVTLAGIHGVDLDADAVALAEVRLALVSGCRPDTSRLLVGNSLLPASPPDWLQEPRFDLVLGNPPFVSTKGLDAASDRQALLNRYGYADDLYVHFVDRGLALLRPRGWLLFILSDTFRTTVTKARMRQRLLEERLVRLETLPPDSFPAVVATVALTVRREPPSALVQVPPYGPVPMDELVFGPRRVIIDPSPANRDRLASLQPQWAELIERWWPLLRDSRRQLAAAPAILAHRQTLTPGDWTLLGLLCEGGVGLQTGDNGLFLGIRADAPEAAALRRRQQDLLAAWRADGELSPYVGRDDFETVAERLRQRFPAGRLGFKRGEVWRLVPPSAVADPMAWPEAWRRDGAAQGPAWVPYEKGDPAGRRWSHANPFVIRWDEATVQRLRASKRGRGEPVLRNPRFFFRAGVTWSNMSSHSLKARLQPPCVFDVGSMTLFPLAEWLDPYVLVAWLNASVTNRLLKAFINHTLNFQINDLRLLPIKVPDPALVTALGALARAAVAQSPAESTAAIESELDRILARHYGPAWVQSVGDGALDRTDFGLVR